MNESFSFARGDLGAVRNADEVRMTIMAISAVELISRCDYERLDGVTGLGQT